MSTHCRGLRGRRAATPPTVKLCIISPVGTRRLALVVVILLALGSAAEARTYFAERYNSHVDVLRGGTLRITETVTLRFEDGPFTQFFRMVPAPHTDGIEIVSASMDGRVLPHGDGPGQVHISGSSHVRVTWRFAPVSHASHTFELAYLVRGVVRRDENVDVLAWRILPTEHAYRIDASSTEIVLPELPAAPPTVERRRVGDAAVTTAGTRVRVEATDIRSNGWIEAWVRLPRDAVITAPPVWQQRQETARALAGTWLLAACLVFVCGAALLAAIRQRYDSPPADLSPGTAWTTPPDNLPPALAGMLLTNGSANLEQAMALIFSLADRGELRIDEAGRTLGQRSFSITRTPTGRPLQSAEARAVDIIFRTRHGEETSVSLGKARSRLMRQLRRLREALNADMRAAGLIDDDRLAVRRRFLRAGAALLTAAGLLTICFAFLTNQYAGWPMLIPLAVAVLGIVALIAYAAHTPLSNEGVRRSNQWRGFRRYLRDVARDRAAAPGANAAGQLLSFAVALGVAHAWSAYLKRHRASVPAWFRAAADSGANNGAAFAAFVATGGTGAGGHAHGGAGAGAAGGGASGAS